MSLIEQIRKLFPPEYYVWSDTEKRPETRISINSEERQELETWLAKAKKVIRDEKPSNLGPEADQAVQNMWIHTINSLILQIQQDHITSNQIVSVSQDLLRRTVCDLFTRNEDQHPELTKLSLAWLKRFNPHEAAKFNKTIDEHMSRS